MDNQKMTPQESIDIITNIMNTTKQRIEKKSGTPFLIWGYATLFVSIIVYYVTSLTGNPWYNFLWYLIPCIGMPLTLRHHKKQTKEITTPIQKSISYLWMFLGFLGLLLTIYPSILINTTDYNFQALPYRILFIMLLLMTVGTGFTAILIRSKTIFYGAIIGTIGTFALPYLSLYFNSILIFGIIFFLFMVIPGHILNFKTKQNVHKA